VSVVPEVNPTGAPHPTTESPVDMATLREIERRVLWLAVRMVDWANHDRLGPDGKSTEIKVGGHQASSASIVSLMTALWFGVLEPGDRVSVKPHASPIFHAVQYLLGSLDERYLTTLREFGGLQSYPSRTKDPEPIDFSTGSVGLGAAAPLFAAAAERYIYAHFPDRVSRGRVPRYVALMGDAELDEGNVWEAIIDPATHGLGNVTWVVDLNRQSLDRVIPGIKAQRLEQMFAHNDWHVVEVKYGKRLEAAFEMAGGHLLREHIDAMSNEQYQSLFALQGSPLRQRFCDGASAELIEFLSKWPDDEVGDLVLNLGGHDLEALLSAFHEADAVTDRPSVIFAYTVKGWGLPIAGDPMNHAALLTETQIGDFRSELGLDESTEWDRFPAESAAGAWCDRVGAALRSADVFPPQSTVDVPETLGHRPPKKPSSTQEAFGRLMVAAAERPGLVEHLITASPDVTISTNLGGWINKVGVFAPVDEIDWLGEGRMLKWQPSPRGQHVELGISEMNLFLLLGQLGLTQEHTGETLIPIGTVYDPFVLRGLDAFIYGVYSGAKFIVVGTPSGVSLSYEGGAHQSTVTASVGLELPSVSFTEPTYGIALDWLLCDGMRNVVDRKSGESMYLRLTTRPIDQAPFASAIERVGEESLRAAVRAGGYRLHESTVDGPVVTLVSSGAVMPEVLVAAAALESEGVAASVVDVTSLDRLYRGWNRSHTEAVRGVRAPDDSFHLSTLFPAASRGAPIVTVHDAASHAMAWLGSVYGSPTVSLGVDEFGQSGSIEELHRHFLLDPDSIVHAALGQI
jgi:pyruvate dehydrogenase E1 component